VVRGKEASWVKIVFCFTGKTVKGPVYEIVEDYRARIRKWAGVEIIEAKNLRLQSREGIHLLLSPSGRTLSSEEFADIIQKSMEQAVKHLFFYTGGPSGICKEIASKADMTLSLSAMTFNHQLVRAMLLEQVYRAFTIIRGEPYHK